MTATPSAQQREAIEAPLGPVLVLAGPGAGKTFCLIGRVGYLIERLGFPADRICAVTFTNKAAEEIAARLQGGLGPAAEGVTRGTLHSLCVGVLREHGSLVGLGRGFGIADERYQRLVLRRLRVAERRRGPLLALFARRRSQGYRLTPGDEALFDRYREHLRSRELADFDDLIILTAELLRDHPEVAPVVAGRWDYVLVDEFQDLNPAQYEILKHLTARHRNLFAVGDDEQSIFSWTGANPKVLRQFARDFGIERPIALDENRRCSRQIFEAARRLVAVNPALFEKRLRAERASVHEVCAFAFGDEREEAEWMLADLVADRATSGLDWGDYAILYRQHHVADPLEQLLVGRGVPCRLARGRALQDDPVIAQVAASLRIILAPDDPLLVEALAEIVLPPHLLEEIRGGDDRGGDLPQALRAFVGRAKRSHPDAKRAWRFIYHVENLEALRKRHTTLSGLVEELLAQPLGEYRNALEERHEELSDPAADPKVTALAAKLSGALAGRAKVWVRPGAGVEIALRGLLVGGGVTMVGYLDPGVSPGPGDLVLEPHDGGGHELPLAVFKALQLIHSRDFGGGFPEYVSFDLETTSDDTSTCEIVEIGAARVRNGEVVDRFHSLVRPRGPISEEARRVHGHSDEDVRGAPAFEQVWPRFLEFVGRTLLVAHNGQEFDVPVLRRLAANLRGLDDLLFYDTLPLARSVCRGSAKLPDLAHRFGIPAGREHHALDDAITLAGVFRELEARNLIRARKAALVNLLDFLGLALALPDGPPLSPEATLVLDAARVFTLGRYSDCLEVYAQAQPERPGAPPVEQVIERLGGRALMERIRADVDPARRYPTAVSRLRALSGA
ncbi:MAG: UvrD-helicase domain-containing protein, partial [Gemmatimonadales bacterium]